MYDATFVRTWWPYLAGLIGAFSTGSPQPSQVIITHGKDDSVPLTRCHANPDS